MILRFCTLCSLLLLGGLLTLSAASEWPKGYIVAEDTTSPDGLHALLILSQEAEAADEMAEALNSIVDLKTKQSLGDIDGGDYTQNENHRGLEVHWAADSTWCIVHYEARYGFDSIHVVELGKNGLTQKEIGKTVQDSLNAVIVKQAHTKDVGCDAEVFYRLSPDRKVRVRALALTNPKQLENVGTYYALFQGTYDLNKRRWTATDTRPVTTQYDALDAGLRDMDFSKETYTSEDDRATSLDTLLNNAYEAARFILPADRFATVKREQMEWLKTRDAAKSDKEKSALVEARIKALQDLLW